MEIFLMYLKVFVVGGGICLVAQILMNFTKLTPARILVIFLLIGVVLEAMFGTYSKIIEFSGSGASIPITGFGSVLAKGAMEGAKKGIIPALTNGFCKGLPGILAVILFAFIASIIFRSKTKKH